MTLIERLHAGLLAAILLLGVLWLLDLPLRLNLAFVTAEFLSLLTGLGVAAVFLGHRGTGRTAWLDVPLAVLAIASWGWGAFNHSEWLLDIFNRGPEMWLPGVAALLTLLEALRRSCGMAISLLVAVIAAYGFFGHWLPGVLEAAYTAPTRLVMYLYTDTNGVPGLVLSVGATVVLAFILFGKVLEASGGTGFFTDLAMASMGHRRGGAAKVSIVASSIFGTLSGTTVGNVMSTGVVTIPLMKRFGFTPHYAGAVEAVASNGGQLAPPVMGATAFLIAEFLQIDYTEVVLAALLPAIIYYVVLFLQVDAYAARRGLAGLDRSELPSLRRTLIGGWGFLLPLALLIYLLFWLGYSPGKSALYSAFMALGLYVVMTRKWPGPRFLIGLLIAAGRTLLPVLMVCAAAGVVTGVLNISGLGFTLTLALTQIAESAGLLAMLGVTALIAVGLGMGMPTAAVYVVLSVILAPALVKMGIPELSAHLFIFYFGLLSMLTPPVAIASYAASSLAESDMWRTGLEGLKLAAVAYLLPFVFCFNPALLMQGSLLAICAAGLTMVASGFLLAQALAGRNRGVLAGAAGRLLLGLLSIGVGTATLWLGPESPWALVLAAAVLVIPLAARVRPAVLSGGDA